MDNRSKIKIIYKIPHGFYSGGCYFKVAPTITVSAWQENNFFVWIKPKQDNIQK